MSGFGRRSVVGLGCGLAALYLGVACLPEATLLPADTTSTSSGSASSSSGGMGGGGSTGSSSASGMGGSGGSETTSSATGTGGAGGATSSSASGTGGAGGTGGGDPCVGSPICTGDEFWSTTFGDFDDGQQGRDIVNDPQGNVIVVGRFAGDIGFGPSAGGADVFVAKLDPSGALIWGKAFGGSGDDAARAVAVDAGGSIYVLGESNGDLDFGCGVTMSAGGNDIVLAKLLPSGSCEWSKRYGDAANQSGEAIASNGAGDVIITGRMQGTVSFGGSPLTSAGGDDLFIARISSVGTHLYSHRYGDGGTQQGRSVALDAQGNAYILGHFDGTLDLGKGPMASAGQLDVFLAKLDTGGATVWNKRFGDGSPQFGTSVVVDKADRVLITGHAHGSIDFGGGPLTSGGLGDIYVAKLDASGAHVWSKRFGEAGDQFSFGVATDASNNVLLAGQFQVSVDFGGGALTSLGGTDVFVAKLTAGGAHVWSRRFGDGSDETGAGLAVDNAGAALVTGDFAGNIDFGKGPHASEGLRDAYAVKLAP